MRFFKDMYLIFKKDLKHYWRWKLSLFFDVAAPLTDLIFFIIMWSVIVQGGFDNAGILTKENYIVFLVSGFIVWRFIRVSFSHEVAFAFINEKYWRTIQNLLLSPINRISIAFGKTILGLLRSCLAGIVLLAVGILFLGFQINGSPLLIMLIIMLTFIGFSGVGITVAGLASWREDIADLHWFVSFILAIASGLYFPIEALPPNISNALMMIPSSQAIHAIRLIAIEGTGFTQLLPIITNLSIFSVVSVILAIITFKFVERKAMLIGI